MSKGQKNLRLQTEKCQNHEQIKQLRKSRKKILKQISHKIKISLNLHKYSYTRQFEDSKCKYNKRIFKFKSKFEEMLVQDLTFVRLT